MSIADAYAGIVFDIDGVLMRGDAALPGAGSVPLLLVLSSVYLLALLSFGLLISSRAGSQMEAMQMAMGIMLPSVLLSGYVFPLASLPLPLRMISYVLPATHFIRIARGIVIRGATFADLWEPVLALLSKKAGRPVKGVFTREEEFIATTVRHPFVMDYKTGVTREGRILARRMRLVLDGVFVDVPGDLVAPSVAFWRDALGLRVVGTMEDCYDLSDGEHNVSREGKEGPEAPLKPRQAAQLV